MKRIFLLFILATVTLANHKAGCETVIGCLECPTPNVCDICDEAKHFQPHPNDKFGCDCVHGYYWNRSQCITCDNSHPYCLNCTQDGVICNQCQDSHYLDKGNCPSCGTGCLLCTSSSKCDKCAPGYIQNGTICKSCGVTNCQACTKVNHCDQCISGFFVKHHPVTISRSDTCDKCIANCDKCTSNTTCSQCVQGFYINASKCVSCSSIQDCLSCSNGGSCTVCKNTSYLDAGKCPTCKANQYCLTCISLTNCTQCQSNQYLLNGGACEFCNKTLEKCFTCQNRKQVPYCLGCLDLTSFLSNGKCLSCAQYNTNCIECDGVDKCSKCKQKVTYLEKGHCVSCSDSQGCVQCKSGAQCIVCQPKTYILEENKCRNCQQKITNCLQCDSKQCNKCIENYLFKEGACTLCRQILKACNICNQNGTCRQCDVGHYDKPDGTCQDCDKLTEGCIDCSNDGQCLHCVAETYLDKDANKCLPCTLHCQNCIKADICQTCYQTFSQDETGKCVTCDTKIKYCDQCQTLDKCTTCKGDAIFVPLNNNCKTCGELFVGCVKCKLQSCQQCESGRDLSDGACKESSPPSPIAAIIVGIVGGVAVIGLASFLIVKRLRKKKQTQSLISNNGQDQPGQNILS